MSFEETPQDIRDDLCGTVASFINRLKRIQPHLLKSLYRSTWMTWTAVQWRVYGGSNFTFCPKCNFAFTLHNSGFGIFGTKLYKRTPAYIKTLPELLCPWCWSEE